MVAPHILHTLCLQSGQQLGLRDDALQLGLHALLGGFHIHDGAQLLFAQYLIVLRFAAAHAHDTLRHGQQRVHRGGVAVELVHNHVTAVHHLLVFGEGHRLGYAQFHPLRMPLLHRLCRPQHDVGAFVGAALAVDAEKHFDFLALLPQPRCLGWHLDGVGNEGCLLGEGGMVTHPVFVQTRHDGVAVGGYAAVQPFLFCPQPVAAVAQCLLVVAQPVAYVEVAVSQRSVFHAGFHPVPVHTEGSHHHVAVVAPQVVVDGFYALGLQLQKERVYQLHHVVAPELWQQGGQMGHISHAPQASRSPRQVDIAGIVFPEVAVGEHGHVVAQHFQSLGQCGVHIAVFA